jgi:hypothetical protein
MKRVAAGKLFVIAGIAIAGLLPAGMSVAAEDPLVQDEMARDVVLRAMVQELERSVSGLTIEGLERPYFIEYAAQDALSAGIDAEWGSIVRKQVMPSRVLRVDVRVGSYTLDNTNFMGSGSDSGRFGGASMPTEDDCTAIRQAIWWATDREYKDVVEQLERKKAFMASKVIDDKPEDFSHETPVVDFEIRLTPEVPIDQLVELAKASSVVFKDFPEIQEATVSIRLGAGNQYLVNSEGTRLRTQGTVCQISASASVQTDDGMKLSDDTSAYVLEWKDLPTGAAFGAQCRALAERLVRVRNAPRLKESYTGPVLFSPQAGTQVFARTFGRRFAGGQRPVGSRPDPDDFEKRIDKRILPRSVEVIDDPTQKTIAGVQAVGHYRFDDEGVPPRPVQLVEGGRLKTLVMSRNPSKLFKQSTGHAQGFYNPSSGAACLVMRATDAANAETMKKEFREACEDEGLAFGIRIDSLMGANPLEMYKVYPDGREELVRGGEAPNIDLRAFKRILAVGDEPYVLNYASSQAAMTIAAPALLFEELDINPIDRDFDKPPYLPAPLARPATEQAAATTP